MNRILGMVAPLLAVLLAVGCGGSSDGLELSVDVRTDFAPGIEFDLVRTELDPGGRVEAGALNTAEATEAFFRGRRVAEFDELGEGTIRVSVSLIRASDGMTVASRESVVALSNSTALTVVLARNCSGVSCPGGSDDTTATECEAGVCVPPECTSETPEACPPTAFCASNADCTGPALAACGRRVCDRRVCLIERDDASCGEGFFCDPRMGCTRFSGEADGGAPEDASVASDAGGACAGACDDGNPCTDDVCDPVEGCQHTDNTAPCDDGDFCTGVDTCAGGACVSAGNPCVAPTVCSGDACVGCITDADCPADSEGPWSSCSYGSSCASSGTRSREVTSYSCVDVACEADTSTENDSAGCTRSVCTPGDNRSCGTRGNQTCSDACTWCGCFERDPSCSGSPGLWNGCRGTGCSVCTDLVEAYPCYWENHPGCIPNAQCEGSYFQCNDTCPAPDAADMCVCGGNAGGFNGCNGGGCSVCPERVAAFACYFINHPACTPNDSCGGSYSQCNAKCPAPTAADNGT